MLQNFTFADPDEAKFVIEPLPSGLGDPAVSFSFSRMLSSSPIERSVREPEVLPRDCERGRPFVLMPAAED